MSMENERFIVLKSEAKVKDTLVPERGHIWCADESEAVACAGLLNELHEENVRLKNENTKRKLELSQLKPQLHDLEKRVHVLEHDLTSVDGLYASDKEDFSHPFRLDFSKVLNHTGDEE